MSILWNYTGAVTQNSATVVAKLPYEYGDIVKNMKLYSLVYDGTFIRGYVNGKLIGTDDQVTAGVGTLGTLFFGADYDDTCWLKGKVPQILMLSQALNENDRQSYENFLADKWLNAGTTLGHGYVVKSFATDLAPIDSSVIKIFDFNEEGINTETGEWVSTANGQPIIPIEIKATPVNGKGFTVVEQKNKDCVYFDKTFLELTNITGSYTPDSFTLFFLIEFEDFDSSPYPDGDAAQVLISSTNNQKLRIKKFNIDNYLGVRFRDYDGRSLYIDYQREDILGTNMVNQILGSVQLHLGTAPDALSPYGAPKVINNYTDFGIYKENVLQLIEDTTYYGVLSVDGVIDIESAFKFKTMPQGAKSFRVVCGSCNRTGSTAPTWDRIVQENPDIMIHLGDLNYLDLNSYSKQRYAEALDISISAPIKNMLRNLPFQYMYDNHDSLKPTVSVEDPTWPTFMEFVRDNHAYHTPGSSNIVENGLYGVFTMGRVRFISLDCRRNRTPQRQPDSANKTMLGVVQKAWLKEQLIAARDDENIEAIVLLSQVLWTGERDNPLGDSYDSWGASWASYPTERKELANFIYYNQVKNVSIICADVHMQAIDNGRGSCYITDEFDNVIPFENIPPEYRIVSLQASPFDQYLSEEGGPFFITEVSGSGGGRIGSSEQSYGVFEVLDRGQKWLQIKMYTVALFNGVWETNRYYTFNLNCDNGEEGIAPPLDWNTPNFVNYNGYVSDGQNWKSVLARYISIGGGFKEELFRWKFLNGSWKKIYDANTINDNMPIVLYEATGWTVEERNFIRLSGRGFLDATLPLRFGAFYRLGSNTGDSFGNFPYATINGVIDFGIVNNQPSATIVAGSSIEFPSAQNIGFTFNSLYDKDFFLGVHFNAYFSERKILRNATGTWYIGLSADKSVIEVRLGSTFNVDVPITFGISNPWVYFYINFKNGNDGIHTVIGTTGPNGTTYTQSGQGLSIEALSEVNPFILGNDNEGTGIVVKDFYYTPRYNTESDISRFKEVLKPRVKFTSVDNPEFSFDIPAENDSGETNEAKSFVIPHGIPNGMYTTVVYVGDYSSNPLYINVDKTPVYDKTYITDFKDVQNFKDNFYIFHKAWGGANGGVVVENIELNGDGLRIYANGDLYSGNIQGVNRDGDPKFHTHPNDPKLGQPWTNRVGGTIVFKHKTGFGSYRVKATIPTELGVCAAFWTFFYNEVYPGSAAWTEFLAEGLHPQGNEIDGYYMTRNHEIDIEFPSHLDGGILAEPSFNNMKCNTWRGELQNWDVPPSHPDYWEEYRDNLTPTGIDMYAGGEHEFRFDWYEDKVEFFIDGVLKRTNVNTPKSNNLPTIAGHFTFGLWFPSSPMLNRPWLVRPDRAWAGGTIDSDGGRKAMFDRVHMDITEFSYIPFDNTNIVNTGETYPFGAYRVKTDY